MRLECQGLPHQYATNAGALGELYMEHSSMIPPPQTPFRELFISGINTTRSNGGFTASKVQIRHGYHN